MKSEQKFYRCKHCGNLVDMIYSSGVNMVCCNEEMQQIVDNTVDASVEKHLPYITVAENQVTVKVGSAPHPMTKEHLIEWIYLKTSDGCYRKNLSDENEPEVKYLIAEDEKPIGVYAYCNLHGLWYKEV